MDNTNRHITPLVTDDMWSHDVSGDHIGADELAWHPDDLNSELVRRATIEKNRRTLTVDYYRIGFTLDFPLPLRYRPDNWPIGIQGGYPWMIWLSWTLEKRWRTLHAAWRLLGDQDAGRLVQRELSNLERWHNYREANNSVGLVTGHIAACIAMALANTRGWDEQRLKSVQNAATKLIDNDITPWFEHDWPSLDQPTMHNIPVITLIAATRLAEIINHNTAKILSDATINWLDHWHKARTDHHHTEAAAYDGYLFDTVTEYLQDHPQRQEIIDTHYQPLRSLVDQWMNLNLPGHLDILAPLGDVEPQMSVWITPLFRLGEWLDSFESHWVIRRIPVTQLPPASLELAISNITRFDPADPSPAVGICRLVNAVVLRGGWEPDDAMLALSANHCDNGHLHHDAGSIVIGWAKRWWITDPGYQQYLPGEQRDFTIGPHAHNCPIVNGIYQTHHAAKLITNNDEESPVQHIAVDITKCYENLPDNAAVIRSTNLLVPDWVDVHGVVVVRDSINDFPPGTTIETNWHSDTHLGWSFIDGWARLTDGEYAMWIGCSGSPIVPQFLNRHPGSTGPLTLTCQFTTNSPNERNWWVFVMRHANNWDTPVISDMVNEIELCVGDECVVVNW